MILSNSPILILRPNYCASSKIRKLTYDESSCFPVCRAYPLNLQSIFTPLWLKRHAEHYHSQRGTVLAFLFVGGSREILKHQALQGCWMSFWNQVFGGPAALKPCFPQGCRPCAPAPSSLHLWIIKHAQRFIQHVLWFIKKLSWPTEKVLLATRL